MVPPRGRLWSAFAILVGVLLVLPGLAAPASAATARSLSISISPSAVNAGGSVSVSGRLTKSPSGATVRIQRKVGTSWVTATSTRTTSSYGGYKVKLTMPTTPGKYQFRSIAGATASLLAATSATATATALRKVVVKLVSNKTTIGVGETIQLSGKVSPFRAGTVATIQRFNGIRWSTLVTVTISTTGTFKRFLKPEATTTYRVVVPRTGLLATGISPSVRVLIPLGPVDPVINTSTLPGGFTDTFYNQTLSKTGKSGTWAVTSGALPPGLSLGSTNGAISGTPAAGGSFAFTVTFSETETLLSDSQALSIDVLVKPRITTTSLPDATGFVSYGPVTLQKTGQVGAWSITAGTLPAGIAFDNATGVLSGKPTLKVAGDYPLTFKYTETAAPQLSATKQLTLHLDAAPDPVITTTALPDATAFSNYTTSLAKTGKAGTWSITAGVLPAGVTFDTATGQLDGRPTVSGDFGLTFRFTETESTTFGSKQLTLHVNPAPDPVITTTALPDATAYSIYSTSVVRTGNAGAWSLSGDALPAGLSFDTGTGALTGKPTEAGDFLLTFTFTETESGASASKQLNLHVNPAPKPVITTTALPDATAYSTYSTSVVRTGNAGTWSITAGTLPAGVTFDAATGELAGRPTVSGDFGLTFRFTETESGAFGSKQLNLHVNPAPKPVITTTALPDATAFSNYSTSLAKTGNAGTWSITAGTLPAGVTFDSATGELAGRPTVSGDFLLTFRFTETESGAFGSKQLNLHVNPAPNPVITTTALPSATAFSNYSTSLAKTGNAGTWSITAGTLPAGVTLDAATGELAGRPTVSGDFLLTFRFTESESGAFGSKQLNLHVNPAPNPVITTTSLPDGLIDSPYSATLTVSTAPPGAWSIASGSLPTGLNLNATTGAISGTPTVSGTFAVTVRFTETESGATATKALQVKIFSRPTITTTALADALRGSAYSQQLTSSGGSGTGSWTVTAGSLPTGLSLSAAGAITGTATVNGDYTFTVRIGDSVTGASATRVLTIHVGIVAIFTATTPAGKVGTAYSLQFTGKPSNIGMGGWSVGSGTLPPGLSFGTTGLLAGTPTVAGDYTFAVTYAVLLTGTRTRTYTLHVAP